ncbi:hypothetical protein [Terrimonas pollutisoli]|uniref:hypothetical protein n=1 Tax=Terrimonas pollutisoli TaxID=3034147 RepID=UPI0023EBFB34|nr:hypothetical protein [Terrimonas sp. H1YJ31]
MTVPHVSGQCSFLKIPLEKDREFRYSMHLAGITFATQLLANPNPEEINPKLAVDLAG